MPQLGETVVEGTITKWLKKEGDTVERDEPLFEISTDKVDTEVPSPIAGKIVEIKVPEGETVQVGTELALIESGGDGQAAQAEADAEGPAEAEAEGPAEVEAEAPAQAEEQVRTQEAPQSEPDAGLPAEPEPEPSKSEEAPSPAGDGRGQEAAAREAARAPAATAISAPADAGPRSHILSPLVR